MAKRKRNALSERLAAASGKQARTWFVSLPQEAQDELTQMRTEYHAGTTGAHLSMCAVADVVRGYLAEEYGIDVQVRRQQITNWLTNGKKETQSG